MCKRRPGRSRLIEAAKQLHLRLPELFPIGWGGIRFRQAGVIGTRSSRRCVGRRRQHRGQVAGRSQPTRVPTSTSTARQLATICSRRSANTSDQGRSRAEPSSSAAAPEQVGNVATFARCPDGSMGDTPMSRLRFRLVRLGFDDRDGCVRIRWSWPGPPHGETSHDVHELKACQHRRSNPNGRVAASGRDQHP